MSNQTTVCLNQYVVSQIVCTVETFSLDRDVIYCFLCFCGNNKIFLSFWVESRVCASLCPLKGFLYIFTSAITRLIDLVVVALQYEMSVAVQSIEGTGLTAATA